MARTPRSLLGAAIPLPNVASAEAEAIAALDEAIAAVIGPLAGEHDAGGRYPTRAIVALKACGILHISVPKALGGLGASHVTSLESQVRIAAADSSVAQIFKVHDELVREIFAFCPDDLRARLARAVLEDDAILGLAVAEATTTVADQLRTTAAPEPDGGFVIDGTKIYTTGAAEADFVAVWGINPDALDPEQPWLALQLNLVRAATAGMTIHRDWDAIGQRATDSGTISFSGVRTDPQWRASEPGRAPLPHSGVRFEAGFAACTLGIGIGAMRAAIPFVHEHSRPWPSAGVSNAADDLLGQRKAGQLVADLAAAHALVARCGELLDAFERGEITRTALAIPIYAARSASDRAGLAAASEVLSLLGTRSARRTHGFDLWWRNARTLSLHDPVEWKHAEIGRHVLTGWDPPPGIYT